MYGHPEAGALWEARLDDILKNLGWAPVPGTGGIYTHAKTKAAMVVYVDDMLMLSNPRDTDKLWRALEKSVDYKVPSTSSTRSIQRSRGRRAGC